MTIGESKLPAILQNLLSALYVKGGIAVEGNLTIEQKNKKFSIPDWSVDDGGAIITAIFDGKGNTPQVRFIGKKSSDYMDIGENKDADFEIQFNDVPKLTVTKEGNMTLMPKLPWGPGDTSRINFGDEYHYILGGWDEGLVLHDVGLIRATIRNKKTKKDEDKLLINKDGVWMTDKLYIDGGQNGGWCRFEGFYEGPGTVIYAGGAKNVGAPWSPSDARLKKEIKTIASPLEKIKKLSGVTYEWNEAGERVLTQDIDRLVAGPSATEAENEAFRKKAKEKAIKELSQQTYTGLLGQDVKKVAPDLVHEGKDGYLRVEYSKIVALLVEGMKEQEETIAALKQELQMQKEAHEKRMASIEARLAALENGLG